MQNILALQILICNLQIRWLNSKMVWNVTPIFLHYSRLSDLWVNFLKKIHIKNIWADFLKNISPTGPKKSHTPKTGHRRRQVLRSSLGGDARTLLLVNLGRGETPRGSVGSAVGHVFWDPKPDFSMIFHEIFHEFSMVFQILVC